MCGFLGRADVRHQCTRRHARLLLSSDSRWCGRFLFIYLRFVVFTRYTCSDLLCVCAFHYVSVSSLAHQHSTIQKVMRSSPLWRWCSRVSQLFSQRTQYSKWSLGWGCSHKWCRTNYKWKLIPKCRLQTILTQVSIQNHNIVRSMSRIQVVMFARLSILVSSGICWEEAFGFCWKLFDFFRYNLAFESVKGVWFDALFSFVVVRSTVGTEIRIESKRL